MIDRNKIGHIFTLTTFGESHGPAIGGVIDGVPAGLVLNIDEIQHRLDRRRPGRSALTTARNESDEVEFLSGIFEGTTTGAPIGFIIRNRDHRSADYSEIAHAFRPSHADFTYFMKYGGHNDYRGGGRSSARETACRVVAGAVAQQALATLHIDIKAFISQIHDVKLDTHYSQLDLSTIDNNEVRCPDAEKASAMEQSILEAKREADSVGGIVTCVISGVQAGLGAPVFERLNASLAAAMMSINAAKGVEFGDGFEFAAKRGSQVLDFFKMENGKFSTVTNHSGGIQGGISNGQDIVMRIAFKPVATLMRDIPTIDRDGNPVTLHPHGRHDPCVVPRAIPVVEAMAAITILDHYLLHRATSL